MCLLVQTVCVQEKICLCMGVTCVTIAKREGRINGVVREVQRESAGGGTERKREGAGEGERQSGTEKRERKVDGR